MSFFQSSSWNFGPDQGLEDFTDLENNIDVGKNCWWKKGHLINRKLKNITGDLLRMDTGEELQKNSEIRMEKYQQQVNKNIFIIFLVFETKTNTYFKENLF